LQTDRETDDDDGQTTTRTISWTVRHT